MLGRLTRIAVETVLTFYAARAGEEGGLGARTAASSPGRGSGHLRTSEVGEVLERLVRRMERHLRRSGLLRTIEDEGEADGRATPKGTLPLRRSLARRRQPGPSG